jgi:hypothetical protein
VRAPRSNGMTVLVSGMVAGTPYQAGASWSVLQWVLGLRELGYDAILVEEIRPDAVRSPDANLLLSDNARYFLDVTESLGLLDSACLMVSGSFDTVGMTFESMLRAARRADLLLNISGTLRDERVLEAVAVRAYVDVDPGFTQLWELQGHDLGLGHHNRFVTLGLSIGAAHCEVPTGERDWISTLPPVVLSLWPRYMGAPRRAFTTVVNWRGYGSIEHQGVLYGQKVHSFRELFSLPLLTGDEFVLACALHPEESRDLEALSQYGWKLEDPLRAAGSPSLYREFLSTSRAEINVAKSGYVLSRCGWFSDRSACYLACGRPVVAQETGLPGTVPATEGFLTFSGLSEAVEAVAQVNADYSRHCKAARLFAEELLDSRLVLSRVVEEVGR